MNTFETAAVISLVDHLSGPMRSMMAATAGHETSMARQAARMSDLGRHMTYQMTVPILAGMKSMADRAVEFSKVENTLQGVLQNRARTMQGLTVSTKDFANAQVNAIKAAADASYMGGNGLPKGMSNALEYQRSVMAAVKAGMTSTDVTDPVSALAPSIAMANQAVDLALANRIDQHQATDDLISLSNSFGIATKDANNHALSIDKLNTSYGRLGDMLATMTTNSPMSHEEAVQSLKLSAPLAHLAHLDPAVLAAMSATQAEQGIRGSEASVAQRSLLMSLLAPKSTAAAGFKEIGVDLHKYQTMGAGLTPENFVEAMKNQGYRVDAGAARGIFDKLTNGEGDYSYIQATNDLGGLLKRAGKSKSPISPDLANKVANQWVSRQAQSTDVMGLIEDIRDHGGLNAAQWKMIGEGRQYARLSNIVGPHQQGARDVFAFEMSRYFGEDWKNVLAQSREQGPTTSGQPLGAAYMGNAHRQAVEHAQGLEGAYTRMHNAMDKIVMTLSNNGAFDHLADAVVKISEAIATADPRTLKFGTDLALFAAAAGPAIWAIGTLGTAVAAFGKIGGAVHGVEQAAKALPAATRAMERAVSGTAKATTSAADRLLNARIAESVAQGSLERAAHALDRALAQAAGAIERNAETIADAAKAIAPHVREVADQGPVKTAAVRTVSEVASDGVSHAANVLDAKSGAYDAAKAATHDAAVAARIKELGESIAKPLVSKTAMLRMLGGALKGADVITWPLMLADIGEQRNPTTKWNAPYRWDQVPGWAATWEQSNRAAQDMKRDPEAARGRNMMEHGSGGMTGPVQVQGDVKGEAEVHQTMTLEVQPSQYFLGLIKTAESAVKMTLAGSVAQTMAGSNGVKRPVGGNPMGPR